MYNYTAATVEGFCTNDPICEEIIDGKRVCRFTLAINHYSTIDSPPKVSYIDIETNDDLADLAGSTVSKGKRVIVFGKILQKRQADQGDIKSKLFIIADFIKITGYAGGKNVL